MQNLIRFALRIPGDLYQALKLAADKDNRSINSQIIHTLRQSHPPAEAKAVPAPPDPSDASPAE